jgi:hypothetical protein
MMSLGDRRDGGVVGVQVAGMFGKGVEEEGVDEFGDGGSA